MPRWSWLAVALLAVGLVHAAPAPVQAAESGARDAPSLDAIRDAIQRGQESLATAELDMLLASGPRVDVEAMARYLRASLSRARGDLDAALTDVRAVARLDAPLDVARDAMLLEGEILYEAGRYAEAGTVFRRFVELHPEHDRAEYATWYRAEAMARSGSCDEASRLYDTIIETTASNDLRQRAVNGRAWCRRVLGDEAGALRDFTVVAGGDDPELAARARFEVGASAYRTGRYEDALDWLTGGRGEAIGPEDRREVLLGQTLFALDRKSEALPHLEKALSLTGADTHPSLLYQIGSIRLEADEPERAADYFVQLSMVPGLSDSLRVAADYGLGISHVKRGELNEAIGPLERVRSSPRSRWGAESLYALAFVYHRLGDYDRSGRALTELRSRFPSSPLLDEADLMRGENLFRTERYREAIGAYEERLERGESDRADALFRVGIAHFKLGNYDQAARHLNDLILRFPSSPHRTEARFWYAEALYRQGRIPEARDAYEAIRVASPDGPRALDALYGLAWCDYSEGDYAGAAARYGLLLDAYRGRDREDDVLFRRGNCLYNLRRFEEAALDYTRLLERYPDSDLAERALYQKAWALHRLDRHREALAAFEQLESRFPRSTLVPDAVYWSGFSLFRSGDYEQAVARFERVAAMASAPDSMRVEARLRIAESLFNAKDYRRAATQYETMTKAAFPVDVRQRAYDGWIRSLETGGLTAEAERAAASMVQAFPESQTSGEALYRIGVKSLEAGRLKEGIATLKKFLDLGTPKEYVVDANRRCAEAAVKLGDKLRAAEFYRNAAYHGDRRDGIDYRFEAGRLFYELGKFDLATEEFRRVVRLNPDGETGHLARYNYGLALKEIGSLDDAAAMFDEVAGASGVGQGVKADALLEAGLLARKRGNSGRAREALCEAAGLGKGATGAEAQYWCAEGDFEAERFEDAAAGYASVLKRFPDQKEWHISARYRMAECFERLSRWAEAREQYEAILSATDDEAWRADAAERLDWIKENPWVFEQQPQGDPSRWQ